MIAKKNHRARAVQHRFGVASTGNKSVAILFEITRGESLDEHVTWRGWLEGAPENVQRTLEQLKHAGWNGRGPFRKLPGLGSVECLVSVDHETNQEGKTFARGAWIRPLPSLDRQVKQPMEDGEIDALGRSLGVQEPTTNGAASSSGVESTGEHAPFAPSDEVPF